MNPAAADSRSGKLLPKGGVRGSLGKFPKGRIVTDGRRASDAGYSAPAWPERERALRYREQAGRFDQMAGTESLGITRDRLLDLARQYRGLAESLEAKLRPGES